MTGYGIIGCGYAGGIHADNLAKDAEGHGWRLRLIRIMSARKHLRRRGELTLPPP